MEVDADCQRSARHWHQGVRFVCRVERNSSDSLMNGVKQERAHACSEKVHEVHRTVFGTAAEKQSYLHKTAVLS